VFDGLYRPNVEVMGLLCRAESLPRRERLTRRSDYLRAYKEGKRWTSGLFVCYVVRQAGQGRKLGCAVSRKVGRAVVRNRVKRYIREVYRKHRSRLMDDIHLVVVALAPSGDAGYDECAAALQRIFQKGDVLRG
jgi:ribonuclease P protein component